MPQISRALGSFDAAMTELGCSDDVVTFTASDFARTLGSNGKGSDHAWGGQQLVMGGGIDGGKVFGDFPQSLSSPIDPTNGNLDLGRGRLIPTTSVDELAAELAMWFGVNNASDLDLVLPNIGRFLFLQRELTAAWHFQLSSEAPLRSRGQGKPPAQHQHSLVEHKPH